MNQPADQQHAHARPKGGHGTIAVTALAHEIAGPGTDHLMYS